MLYLIDSCCLMTPYRTFAPLDVALSFWKMIKDLFHNENICSIDKVRDEIYKNADELQKWCKSNIDRKDFFLSTEDDKLMSNYKILANWANSYSQYNQNARNDFLNFSRADVFLVAYAMKDNKNITIVTEEEKADNSRTVIKLPTVCRIQNIRTIKFVQLLQELKITY